MARSLPASHLRLVEPDGLDLYRSFEDQLAEQYEESDADPQLRAKVWIAIFTAVIGVAAVMVAWVAIAEVAA